MAQSSQAAHGAAGRDGLPRHGIVCQAPCAIIWSGWAEHGDQEIFSKQGNDRAFDLSGIGLSAARFDFAITRKINGHYIPSRRRSISREAMFEKCWDYVPGMATAQGEYFNDTTLRENSKRAIAEPEGARQDAARVISGFLLHHLPTRAARDWTERLAARLLTPETANVAKLDLALEASLTGVRPRRPQCGISREQNT